MAPPRPLPLSTAHPEEQRSFISSGRKGGERKGEEETSFIRFVCHLFFLSSHNTSLAFTSWSRLSALGSAEERREEERRSGGGGRLVLRQPAYKASEPGFKSVTRARPMRNSSPVFAARASEVVPRPLRAPFHFNSELRAGERRLTLCACVCPCVIPIACVADAGSGGTVAPAREHHAGPTLKTYLCI